jgi:hypothetical protein
MRIKLIIITTTTTTTMIVVITANRRVLLEAQTWKFPNSRTQKWHPSHRKQILKLNNTIKFESQEHSETLWPLIRRNALLPI